MAEPEMVEVIEAVAISSAIPVKHSSGLTNKQLKFIDAYKQLNNGPQAAISAGYAAKSSAVEANRLLKNPAIIREIDDWRKSKRSELTKTDFVDLALKDYQQLELTEANRPRFLDIAGKALGYTSNNTSNVTNNTQINIKGDVNMMSLTNKWDSLRSLMENE